MMKALGRPVDAEPSAADDATIKESSSDGSNKEAGSALVVTRQSTRVAVQTHSKFTTVLRLLKQSQPLVILALVYALLFRRR